MINKTINLIKLIEVIGDNEPPKLSRLVTMKDMGGVDNGWPATMGWCTAQGC